MKIQMTDVPETERIHIQEAAYEIYKYEWKFNHGITLNDEKEAAARYGRYVVSMPSNPVSHEVFLNNAGYRDGLMHRSREEFTADKEMLMEYVRYLIPDDNREMLRQYISCHKTPDNLGEENMAYADKPEDWRIKE